MSAYFQMGHDTENLIGETDLDEFKGIILSPVNRTPKELHENVSNFREKGNYEIILDPQLYFPKTERENLATQPYFPSDFETADITSASWWDKIILPLIKFAKQLKVNIIASPVIQPNIWSDEYFATCLRVSDKLVAELKDKKIRVFTTIMLDMKSMSDKTMGFRVASIMSKANSAGYYVILATDIKPRRELPNSKQLANVMKFIRVLKNTKKQILMAYSSSDMVLYKIAGASHCATGKFFNLRRYTQSRWEDASDGGGGQLSYWFEHSLLAFLRQADISKLREEGYETLLKQNYSNNHWANVILKQLKSDPGRAWVGHSWRHYLSWFGKTELFLSHNGTYDLVNGWLKESEKRWNELNDNDVLFEESKNDGSWIRPWRQALVDFNKNRT